MKTKRAWGSAHNCTCLICGITFHRKAYAIMVGKNKYCSKQCYSKARSEWMKDKSFNPTYKVDFSGEKNPNWKGGVITNGYTWDWPQIKKLVKVRDNYTCRLCGKDQAFVKRKHGVHHIDENKRNNSLENLITICCSCHCKIHKPHLISLTRRATKGGEASAYVPNIS